jgi:hypothetical protein
MKTIRYEVKLEKFVKIILATLAVGILLNAFSSTIRMELFGFKPAWAEYIESSVNVWIENWPS